MKKINSAIFAGIVLWAFSMTTNAATGIIDDCLVFSEQVTRLAEDSFQTRGVMDGSEVKKLKLQYPGIQENRLQMYLSAAGMSWVTSNGARSRVFEKTVENCLRFH